MIKGVGRPEEVAHLGLSNRLLARIGALLKKNFSISLAVLEAAKPGSKLEQMLLGADFLQYASGLSQEKLNALAAASGVEACLALSISDERGRLTPTLSPGGERGNGEELRAGSPQPQMPAGSRRSQVLCLSDELEADEGWSSPGANVLSARGSGAIAANAPAGEQGGGVFSDEHLSRTRLKLATAASAAERIEALRILVYAPSTPAEKAEALLQGLADSEPSVRAEAAVLLPVLGVSNDVATALADLNRTDAARRLAAADKLDKLSSGRGVEFEDGAVIVCAMSALKGEGERELKARLLAMLARRAATLGRNPARLGELIRAVMTLVSAVARAGASSREADEVLAPAGKLVRELARVYPDAVRGLLLTERERAPDFISEAFLIAPLFELIVPGAAEEEVLLQVSAEYLARDTDEGRESRAVGGLIARRGSRAVKKLCEVFPRATDGAKKHILILLDEMCRKPEAAAEDFVLASKVVLEAMEEGSKSLRMAAMECRLVCDMRVPPETRTKLAGAFLDSAGDYSFPFDIEKAESAVARMGGPAVEPLLKRLGAERAANERARAARLLGELALTLRAEPGRLKELQEQLTNALRRLEAAALETSFPDRGEVFSALGKVVSSPAASLEAGAVVMRTLQDAAHGKDAPLASRALEGLSYLASARRASPEVIAETAKLLKEALEAPEPAQLQSQPQNAAGEIVFDIEGGERYAVAMPAALRGLQRVALAPNSSATLAREIGTLLLGKWKEICAGQKIWGPLNTHLVADALREIALSDRCSEELRAEIIKGLFARHTQTPVMHALAEILAKYNSPRLGALALAIGFAMLARRDDEGRFDAVDRADILRALSRLARVKVLVAPPSETEKTPEAFRRTVVGELIRAMKDGVVGAEMALVELKESDELAKELKEEIERRLRGREIALMR